VVGGEVFISRADPTEVERTSQLSGVTLLICNAAGTSIHARER
jgi:hypothetical protein